MELRELVLSTLQEIDENIEKSKEIAKNLTDNRSSFKVKREEQKDTAVERTFIRSDDEIAFLKHTKERLEVLFEGLKSEEIKSHEEKLELTLKYLQLLLSQVDERLEMQK